MPYAIRPAEVADVPQLTEIDKEAFPTTWPSTPFKRDISRGAVSYLVAYEVPGGGKPQATSRRPGDEGNGGPGGQETKGLWQRLGGLFQKEPPSYSGTAAVAIAGYVSLAFMFDEAHVTAIAVRESLRGNGVGELLLLACIELAMKRRSRVVTLEVRVSNHVAQSLYSKYGFNQVGMRKRYYADNHEDAYIMTTDPISSPVYRDVFRRLMEEYEARRGEVALALG